MTNLWSKYHQHSLPAFHYLECRVLHSNGWLIFWRHQAKFANEWLQLGIVIFLQSELELRAATEDITDPYTQNKEKCCHRETLPSPHHLLVDDVHLQGKPPALYGVFRVPVEVELCWSVLSTEIPATEDPHPLLVLQTELQLLNMIVNQPQVSPPDSNIYQAVTVVYDVIILQLKQILKKNMKLLNFLQPEYNS